MTFLHLAPSTYAQDLTEAAAATVVSCENIHREGDESATEALVWAIDNGGLLNFEHALTMVVDQAVNIHEDQRSGPATTAPVALFEVNAVDRDRAAATSEPVVFGNWMPVGADEEDRILSLLSLEAS